MRHSYRKIHRWLRTQGYRTRAYSLLFAAKLLRLADNYKLDESDPEECARIRAKQAAARTEADWAEENARWILDSLMYGSL
jgi:hypothetical protein